MSSEKVELKLLDNGLHFLIIGMNSESLNFGAKKDFLYWKYAILNFYSGIELLLKDRLLREHWALIFENIENANVQKLQSGDFLSVNYNSLITRLKNISKIKFKDVDERSIDELRKLRNKIQHYEFSLAITECKTIIAKALNAVLDFIDLNYKKTQLTTQQAELIQSIRYNAYNFAEYIDYKKILNSEILTKANKNGVVSPCPICEETTVVSFKNKKSRCVICNYSSANDEIAKSEYLQSIINRVEKILVEEKCSCGGNLIKYYNPMKIPQKIIAYCFKCGEKESMRLTNEFIEKK